MSWKTQWRWHNGGMAAGGSNLLLIWDLVSEYWRLSVPLSNWPMGLPESRAGRAASSSSSSTWQGAAYCEFHLQGSARIEVEVLKSAGQPWPLRPQSTASGPVLSAVREGHDSAARPASKLSTRAFCLSPHQPTTESASARCTAAPRHPSCCPVISQPGKERGGMWTGTRNPPKEDSGPARYRLDSKGYVWASERKGCGTPGAVCAASLLCASTHLTQTHYDLCQTWMLVWCSRNP